MAVWDPTDTRFSRAASRCSNPNGIWYTAVSGIWQTVWLEPVPAAHIREIAMTPDIDAHELRLTVATAESAGFHGDGEIARQSGGPRHGEDQRRGETAAQSGWSCGPPMRRRSTIWTVALKTGDSVKSYFGMRKVEIAQRCGRRQSLFLNNKPLFQIGPLDQGWWPDGLYTAPTDEALRVRHRHH